VAVDSFFYVFCCQVLANTVTSSSTEFTALFQVTELLIKHGANVNAMDLWQFTPLHEAASKNRVEVCSLLLAHGGDPTIANCHSKTAIDVAPNRYALYWTSVYTAQFICRLAAVMVVRRWAE